jgi:hypothetical protein
MAQQLQNQGPTALTKINSISQCVECCVKLCDSDGYTAYVLASLCKFAACLRCYFSSIFMCGKLLLVTDGALCSWLCLWPWQPGGPVEPFPQRDSTTLSLKELP